MPHADKELGVSTRPTNTKMLTAVAEKEKRHFKVYQEFTPNPRRENVTPKFYARHQMLTTEVPQEYLDLVTKVAYSVPSDRCKYPETENQRYGWYPKTLTDVRDNKRLHFPASHDPDIKLLAEIKRNLPKEKKTEFFTVPFKL